MTPTLLTWTGQAALNAFSSFTKTSTQRAWQYYPPKNWVKNSELKRDHLGQKTYMVSFLATGYYDFRSSDRRAKRGKSEVGNRPHGSLSKGSRTSRVSRLLVTRKLGRQQKIDGEGGGGANKGADRMQKKLFRSYKNACYEGKLHGN